MLSVEITITMHYDCCGASVSWWEESIIKLPPKKGEGTKEKAILEERSDFIKVDLSRLRVLTIHDHLWAQVL